MSSEPLEPRFRPRREPRQRRSAETRARILSAARDVFAERGYAGGTTNHIAESAGMSVGSLYQYFPNKDAILVELIDEHIDDGTEAITAALGAVDVDDPAAMVRQIVAAMVGLHARERRLHQVLFEESPRPVALLERLRRLESTAVEVVASIFVAADIGGDDPAVRARMTVVTIESVVHRLVAADDSLDPGTVVDELTTMVCAYLGVTAAP